MYFLHVTVVSVRPRLQAGTTRGFESDGGLVVDMLT